MSATRSQSAQSGAAELGEVRRELELERRRYRDLFDLAPVGYVVTDLEGLVLEANRAACELLAREASALLDTKLGTLVTESRRADFDALLGEAARGARWQDELPFLTSHGGSTLLLVHAAGPEGPDSAPAIRLALADAVTVPRQHARGPDAGDGFPIDRLSHVLDRLQHAVVTLNSELRVSYANSAAEALLSEGGSLAGRALPDSWPGAPLHALVERIFERGAGPAETRVTLGGAGVYDVLALPPDASGEALLVIADVSSVLRRERAEREFVANAAHQLRTPVAAIASAIEVLQGGAKEVPEARDRFLSHLDRQCNRLVRLTRALLLLARAQALSEPPVVEVVPLRPLLDGIAAALHAEPGVGVRVSCPLDLAAVTNRDLLEQALGNLAENAAKFTAEGEIVLVADTHDDGAIRIVVDDTGPGADLPVGSDFERFYRDPGSQGEGFGLGLAIASEAVRVLHGSLVVEPTEAGTRAVVILPSAGTLKR